MRNALLGLPLLFVLGLSSPAGAHGPTRPVVALEQARAVADTWLATRPPADLRWDWAEGVLAFGLMELAEVTGEPAYAEYVRAWIEHHERGGVEYYWNDDLTPALSAALLALRGSSTGQTLLDGSVRYIFEDGVRTPSGGLRHLGPFILPVQVFGDLWVDSLFHFVPLLVRLHAVRGEDRFLEEAVDQSLLFADTMRDPRTGLYTHAWFDLPRDEPQPPFEEQLFWARGNGWILAALVELLGALPRHHPDCRALRSEARRLERKLRRLQDRDGLWHTLLLDDETYVETAASGLITFGMARGARLGLFGVRTRRAAERGMRGLLGVLEERDGLTVVTGTSRGTNPLSNYAGVRVGDQIPHGVGAWLMAAAESARPPARRWKGDAHAARGSCAARPAAWPKRRARFP